METSLMFLDLCGSQYFNSELIFIMQSSSIVNISDFSFITLIMP
jgi:hypothetical protein